MSKDVPPVRRLRIEAIGLLVMAMAVGALAGVAGERWRVSRQVPDREEDRRDPGALPPPWERIGLTDEQHAQIERILRSRRDRTDSIMRELMPRIRFHLDDVRDEIAEILTEEQLERLDREFQSRRHRGDDQSGRRDYWRGGRRRPPDGGRSPQRPN